MSRSEELFERAQRTIPGGVNSPVRAFRSVGGTPRFIRKAKGPLLWDVDDNCYVDYVGSWGPAILGHAHPAVVRAVQVAAESGLSFGAPTEGEVELAELLTRLMPSMEMVRLTSSGTEATMSAIRLARGFTGRDTIVKFEGCYHGHGDSLLVKAGSGLLTFGNPSSAGVPADIAKHTLVLDYNSIESLEACFKAHGKEIACVIIEPIAGNMNMVRPSDDFLRRLRDLCWLSGALLIFDEVMTGFRVGAHGAQGVLGVTPDLTTLGKVIGGGMPVGAFGGRRDVMQHVSPLGAVYQAGTLSGSPVAVAAGLATLKEVSKHGFYEQLSLRTQELVLGLTNAARDAGVPLQAQAIGGMFGLYFHKHVPATYTEVMSCDKDRFNVFFHAMLSAGHYFAPSAFEAGFVSAAHTSADIQSTIKAARDCLNDMRGASSNTDGNAWMAATLLDPKDLFPE